MADIRLLGDKNSPFLNPSLDFCKKVQERSGGKVKFDIYHSAQLFGGKEEFAAVGRADINVGIPHDIYPTGEVPDLGITSLPFLCDDVDQTMGILRAGLKEMVRPRVEKRVPWRYSFHPASASSYMDEVADESVGVLFIGGSCRGSFCFL